MKKITTAITLFSIFFITTPFAIQAQDMARVTVTIKNLTYVTNDPNDGTMDFYAKIFIGDKMKKFPVRTGNQLRDLNWQFTTTTSSSSANIRIEVWDYDALFTGGDDTICVDGKSRAITKSISTMEIYNANFRSAGACTGSGKESGAISYNITIEPTRTAYLIQGIWKEVKYETKRGAGEWEVTEHQLPGTSFPNCRIDDFLIFRKNSTYVSYEGATKCNTSDPASTPGTWSFQNNDSKLQLNTSRSSSAIIYTVHWIDKTKMILSAYVSSGDARYYERYTFGH